MQQNGYIPDTANAIAQYFNKASLPSQQETLGQIVMDILNEGRHLNRKALCTKLLSRLDRARAPGAYTIESQTVYNNRPRSAVVMIDKNGHDRLIRREDSYEDMVKYDLY